MGEKVLIVDDDQVMLQILQNELAKYTASFSVLTAEDGLIALEKLKENLISLVVTDLEMPRMDGLTLLTHINDHYPDIPVIIITGYSTPAKEEYAREKGVIGFVEKPFVIEELGRQIITALKKESDGGVLHGMAPGTFLQLMEMEQKTCTIRLTDDKSGSRGVLFFRDGELFDARINEVHGKEAAYRILSWEEATLAIQETCPLKENRIQQDLQAILLEAMRQKDERETEPVPIAEPAEESEIIVELEEEPEITIEPEKEPEIPTEPPKEDAVSDRPDSTGDVSLEKADSGDTACTPAAKETTVSYTLKDTILACLDDFKETLLESAVIRYALRTMILLFIILFTVTVYLFSTMETAGDMIREIDRIKTHVRQKQQMLSQMDEEIKRLYAIKENSIKNNESQVAIMELDLKISELEEKAEKIETEIKIQKKALEAWQIKLESLKRKPLFIRLLEHAETYLPWKAATRIP